MDLSGAINSRSYTIKVSVEEMRKKLTQFRTACLNLQNCFRETKKCVDSLETIWKTEGCETLNCIFSQSAAESEELCDRLSDTVGKLDLLISLYDKTEQSITKEIQELPDSVFQ